jgi:hypothetical protein
LRRSPQGRRWEAERNWREDAICVNAFTSASPINPGFPPGRPPSLAVVRAHPRSHKLQDKYRNAVPNVLLPTQPDTGRLSPSGNTRRTTLSCPRPHIPQLTPTPWTGLTMFVTKTLQIRGLIRHDIDTCQSRLVTCRCRRALPPSHLGPNTKLTSQKQAGSNPWLLHLATRGDDELSFSLHKRRTIKRFTRDRTALNCGSVLSG